MKPTTSPLGRIAYTVLEFKPEAVLEVGAPAAFQILSEDVLRANSVSQHPKHLRDSLTRSECDFVI